MEVDIKETVCEEKVLKVCRYHLQALVNAVVELWVENLGIILSR